MCTSRTLKLTIRDEDVVHHVPDVMYMNDQHRHYQINFLFRTAQAQEVEGLTRALQLSSWIIRGRLALSVRSHDSDSLA